MNKGRSQTGAMAFCLALLLLTVGSGGRSLAQSQSPVDLSGKNVLLLHAYNYESASSLVMDPIFMKRFTEAGLDGSNLHFEYMDLNKHADPAYRLDYARFLERKHENRAFDVIIAMHRTALMYLLEEGKDLFPGVPVVNVIADPDFLRPEIRSEYERLMSRMNRPFVILPFSIGTEPTVQSILDLRPDTRKLVVISGSESLDRQMAESTRRGLELWRNKLDMEYLIGLPLEEVLERVSALPPKTAILYTVFGSDLNRTYRNPDVLWRISEAANAPVFGLYDTLLGKGIVGGVMTNHGHEAARAVRMSLEILRGGLPAEQVTVNPAELIPTFDWERLNRWNMSEGRLPPGSVILNRPKTLWTDYREYVIAAVILFLAQSILIGALILQILRRRKAERKYRDIFDGSLEGIFESSREGRMLTANPAFARILGYDSAEEARSSISDSANQVWANPEERTRYVRLLEEQDIVLGFQCQFRRKDGTNIWVSLNTRSVKGPDGKTLFYAGFLEDITERKKAEEALKESEAKYRNLYDSMMDGYVLVDMDGRILQYNETYRAMTGYLQDELQRLTYRDITPAKWHAAERDIIEQQVLVRGYSEVYDKEYRRKDGTLFPIELRTFLLKDERGINIGMWAIVRDITGRKLIESETRKLREDLAHVTRVSTLGELTSSLAHEINQPLAAILSNAQAAQRFLSQGNPDMKEIAEILGDIIRDDNRAAEVIRKIRALLKKEETRFEALNLNDVVEEILNVIRNDTVLTALKIEKAFDSSMPAVWGDRIQLQQVILNLVMNAAEAMRDGSPNRRILTVKTSRKDERFAEVSVADMGPGINERAEGRLFEPFYTTKSGGMGMGLAISRHIVSSHKGEIRAVNNPGAGTTVSFTVPFDNGGKP